MRSNASSFETRIEVLGNTRVSSCFLSKICRLECNDFICCDLFSYPRFGSCQGIHGSTRREASSSLTCHIKASSTVACCFGHVDLVHSVSKRSRTYGSSLRRSMFPENPARANVHAMSVASSGAGTIETEKKRWLLYITETSDRYLVARVRCC